jgi:2-polyprenyl-3-methyl-5-hydroxy-6-metoxy-1,4-benzoquinol methylase
MIRDAQTVCVGHEDVQKESDESLKVYDERNRRLLSAFEKYLPGGSRRMTFLDFGAGDGHVSRTIKGLMEDRCVIYCLEPNPSYEGLYRQYGLIHVKGLAAIPEEIDFVYMIEVIEHLVDPISTLRNVRQILSTAGTVFLSTPEGSEDPRQTSAYDAPAHLHFFTGPSLGLALSAAGFEQMELRHHPDMYPPPPKRGVKHVLYSVKSLAKPLLLPLVRRHVKHGHLVGFTKPR